MKKPRPMQAVWSASSSTTSAYPSEEVSKPPPSFSSIPWPHSCWSTPTASQVLLQPVGLGAVARNMLMTGFDQLALQVLLTLELTCVCVVVSHVRVGSQKAACSLRRVAAQ